MGGLTIRSLLDAGALEHPDRVFSVFPESRHVLTWSELRQAGVRVSACLSAAGIPGGAGVGILMANGRTALELFLGSMYAGRVTATFNPVAGLETLAYVIAHSGVTQLYTDEAHAELAAGAVNLAPSDRTDPRSLVRVTMRCSSTPPAPRVARRASSIPMPACWRGVQTRCLRTSSSGMIGPCVSYRCVISTAWL